MLEQKLTPLEQAEQTIKELASDLKKLKTPAFGTAVVLHAHNEIDPSRFLPNDSVYILNEDVIGSILPGGINEEGEISVRFSDFSTGKYRIGLHGMRPEVKLLGKNDGTHVTIIFQGHQYEANGIFGVKFEPGTVVRVNEYKQIVSAQEGLPGSGEICVVKRVLSDNRSEVESSNHLINAVVFNGKTKVEVNDRVQVDSSRTVILRRLDSESQDDYTLGEEDFDVCWDDVGGCDEAKLELQRVVEHPFIYPELYKYYNKKPPKGILLYGPPGCGKSLLMKAAANSVAKAHGRESVKTGLIVLKGPEILSKWVGIAEERIRSVFKRGRDHYKNYGYPPLLVIDEAEALLSTRGSRTSTDIDSTIVPQFLSEMSGIGKSPSVVILLTNRQDLLDEAAVREGRIDRKIKVPRPDLNAARSILGIHLKGCPLYATETSDVVETVVREIFAKNKRLYAVRSQAASKSLSFTMADCLNGAMLENIVSMAVDIAMERDFGSTPTGVTLRNFVTAVDKQYQQLFGQNHEFAIKDFLEVNGIPSKSATMDKLRPSEG